MKIAIDARMYGPRVGGAGVGRYLEETINALQAIDDHNEYVVFLKRENFDDFPLPNARWTKHVADIHWYGIEEQLRMGKIIDAAKCDIAHIPHFNVSLRMKTPFIVTIHDLIMLKQTWKDRATTRGPIVYALKRLWMGQIMRFAARHARAIITVSEHAKRDIHTLFSVPNSRIHVLYNGVSRSAQSTRSLAKKTSTEIAGWIPEIFILNVGNPYPHKNISTLVAAFGVFVQQYPDVSLVLVGPDNTFTDRLRQQVRDLGIPADRVHFAGFVGDALLDELYERAKVYVIPSKMEGAGVPPLEALNAGTPVIAARASAIPEILGDAAHYFDPNNPYDLALALKTLFTDSSERARILAASTEVLNRYSWNASARSTLDLYESTLHVRPLDTTQPHSTQSRRPRDH